MTNLLAFSSDKVFAAANNTLHLINFDGNILYSHQFDQPIVAVAVDIETNNLATGVKKQGQGKKPNLFGFKIKDDSLELTMSYELPHEAIQLTFASYQNDKSILVLNSGDIDCISIASGTSKTLLGSIATGTSFILNPNLLISSDRDGRIRYSKYPQTFDIQAFGFYHEEFITSLEFIDDNSIISGDGDGQVVKWNLNGQVELVEQLGPKNSIVRKLVFDGHFVYAVIENENCVYLLDKENLKIKDKLELESPPLTISLSPNGNIFALSLNAVYKIDQNHTVSSFVAFENPDVELESYSLEKQRVKTKKIIYKKDKGSEDYDIWRNPEKSPSRD